MIRSLERILTPLKISKILKLPILQQRTIKNSNLYTRMPTPTSSPLKLISDSVIKRDEKISCPLSKSPVKRKFSLSSADSSIENKGGNTVKISKKEGVDRPFTVSVEGNIGSGKSTFLKHFASYPGVATFQEPIEKWTNLNGANLLGKLYESRERWSFLFQSFVQLTRLNIHLEKPDSDVKLIERSFHNNRFCFLESDFHDGKLHEAEYLVLCEYFNFFEKHMDIGVDLIVYIRTTPEIVYKRMKERGRVEESGVPLEYIKRVHHYYERWLMQGLPRAPHAPVMIIDGDVDIKSVFENCQKEMPVIMGKKPFLSR